MVPGSEQVRISAARKVSMQIGSLELQVLVNDRPVREYGHQGRTYIEGKRGSRFTLKFRNNTAQRILAIPSIDGLSAVDGQPATGTSKGYIIPAYSSAEIKGWKQNLRETADFIFTDKSGSSYAAQTHGAQNCGVIAVKVFAEKFVPPPPPPTPIVIREEHHHHHDHYPHWPYWRPWPSIIYSCSTGNITSQGLAGQTVKSSLMCSSNAGPQYTCNLGDLAHPGVTTREMDQSSQAVNAMFSQCLSAEDKTPEFTLGTGYGQVREDVVSEATFERGLELATFEIYYSDESALTAVGVPLNKAAQISKPVPQAFGGFCRPPSVTV